MQWEVRSLGWSLVWLLYVPWQGPWRVRYLTHVFELTWCYIGTTHLTQQSSWDASFLSAGSLKLLWVNWDPWLHTQKTIQIFLIIVGLNFGGDWPYFGGGGPTPFSNLHFFLSIAIGTWCERRCRQSHQNGLSLLAVSLGTSRSFLLVDQSDERTPLLLCFALLWEVGNFGGKEEIENLVYRKVNWYGIFLTLKHDIHKKVSAIFMVCSNLLMKLINAIIYGNLFMKLIKWYNYILIKVLYLL